MSEEKKKEFTPNRRCAKCEKYAILPSSQAMYCEPCLEVYAFLEEQEKKVPAIHHGGCF